MSKYDVKRIEFFIENSPPPPIQLRDIVKAEMQKRGITPRRLALSVDYSPNSLYAWLSGKRPMPEDKLFRILWLFQLIKTP